MTEFVVLIGLVVMAIISMQFYVRRSLTIGIRRVSDVVLGDPATFDPPDPAQAAMNVRFNSVATETGDDSFRRSTTINEAVVGESSSEDSRLQVFVNAPLETPTASTRPVPVPTAMNSTVSTGVTAATAGCQVPGCQTSDLGK